MYKSQLMIRVAASAIAISSFSFAAMAQEGHAASAKAKRQDSIKPARKSGAPVSSEKTESQALNSDNVTNEDIVVTGLRASLASAQTLKKDSDSIVDAVVAEDIGKLPDNNAAEALARVTGVQVNRYNDEANQILVRGLPDVTTTFNGREIFTDQNRNSNVQDFGAGAIAGVEVYKSGTADLIEPGLAGLVNLRSRRPFDIKGFELAGAIRASYNDQTKKADPVGNLLVSNRWTTGVGEIGALLNFQLTKTRYQNAVRWADGYVRTAAGDPNVTWDDVTVATPGVGSDIYFPGGVGLFYSRGTRWRPSLNGSLQWKPADNFELYVDGLWQAYRSQQGNDWFFTSLERDRNGVRPVLSNVVLVEGQPNKVKSLTKTGGYPSEIYRQATDDRVDTYQGAAGFIWNTGRAKITSDIAYTYSMYKASEYTFTSQLAVAPTADVEFEVDGAPNFSLSGFDPQDPKSYIWRGLFDRRFASKGKGWQWRGDVDLETDWAVLPVIEFGARYVSRKSQLDQGWREVFPSELGITIDTLPTGPLETVTDTFRDRNVPTFRNWLAPSRANIRAHYGELLETSREALRELVRRYPGNTYFSENLAKFESEDPAYDPLQGYTADEKTYAFYGQGKYKFDLGFGEVDGVFGVRVVNTDGSYSGISRIVSATGEVTYEPLTNRQNYIDVLPNVSARLKISPEIQMRFAFTKTRTRPSFQQLNPALNITRSNQTGGSTGGSVYDAFGSGGNPDLVPLTSKNYDATFEWYFTRSGSFTASVFYRDLYGFIGNYTRDVIDPVYGRVQLNRPENAGAGKIKGAEFNLQSFFTFLPGFLNGFGGQVNLTYLDGTNRLPTALGEEAPVVPITGVSKWTYNVTAFYEKGPISTRLSYNRRTSWVNSYNRNPGEEQYAGESTRAVARLDYSLSYTPFEKITITFDANNLLATPFSNYRNFNATQYYPRDVRDEGRYYSLGMRFRF